MTKKAKGKRPVYLENSDTDKLLAMVITLASEVSILKERLDTLERLIEAQGLISRETIENYIPDDLVAQEREQWRFDYLSRILRVLED